MDEKLYGTFQVKEIFDDGDAAKLVDVEKDVIGEISLKNIYKRNRIRVTFVSKSTDGRAGAWLSL